MTGVLGEIVAHKREELGERRRRAPLAEVRRRAADADPPRPFLAGLRGGRIQLIAEVKRASPSAGTIRPTFDPVEIARRYEAAGAAAVSVLTDARYFGGADAHLSAVRQAVGLPVLRKDFVVDAYQIYEARSFGADAALLIAAVLPEAALANLQALTEELGMAALVEVHTDEELEAVLATRPALVGINNRNLKTLQTTLEVSRRLRLHIPEGVTVVAESGIEERAQVEELERLGVHAVLVGTALMRAADPAVRVRELLGAAG